MTTIQCKKIFYNDIAGITLTEYLYAVVLWLSHIVYNSTKGTLVRSIRGS
jgi:hypothetical protein